MSLAVASADGEAVQVSEAAFGREFNEPLVHQAVVAWLAVARSGSKAQKSRSDARGGGRKPWRQKRTGRARAGSIRSPIWVGGGRTFAARPADHSQKLNRKMFQGAIHCIFSELLRQNRLVSLSSPAALSLDSPKTKLLANRLDELGVEDVLILTVESDRNLELAARNLRDVEVRNVASIDPVCLLAHQKVLATLPALKAIEERLS
ncbi:MAG: 50S ribosomal protein L4 [Gammaproteobacteria bacterium]|nr:50S ribosomal protein L4 [Gammaproteobacteria bacterium]MYK44988.1 50S ribosomal protein L4 [Gammaproteobacteria bacterium]